MTFVDILLMRADFLHEILHTVKQ